MVVIEIGIMKNGLIVFNRSYHDEKEIKIDIDLRGAFLSVINSFIGETTPNEIEIFKMKKYKIIILNCLEPNLIDSNICIFCIGSTKLDEKMITKILDNILKIFLEKYNNLNDFSGNVSIYNEFKNIIDKIIGDLSKKPSDRLESILN
ncbi:MAG: hypothetical protein ACTSWR_08955 [Candidatus Helarchaeota archaeon]